MDNNLLTLFGGGSQWKPTNIDGCIIWLRSDFAWQDAAKTVPCTNESLIWTGEDKSGLGHDIVQATESKRSVYLTNQINGYPAWISDGIDDLMQTAAFSRDLPSTIFLVFRAITVPVYGDHDTVMDGVAGSRAFYNADSVVMFYGGTYFHLPETFSSGEYILVTIGIASDGGNTSYWRRNGIDKGGYQYPVGGDASGFTLAGSQYQHRVTNIGFVEGILYDTKLNDTNRLLVENYLNGRYAIY